MVTCRARKGELPRNDLSWNDTRDPSLHPLSQAHTLILNSTHFCKNGCPQHGCVLQGLGHPTPSPPPAQKMVHSLVGAVRSHLGKEGDPTQGDRKGQQGGGTAPAKVGWEEPGQGLGWGLAGSLAEWIGSTRQSGPTRRQQDMTGRRQTFLWAHRASWGPPGHSCAQGSPFLGREVPPIRTGSGAPRAQTQLFLLPEACLLPP